MQKVLENLRRINELLLTVGELGLGMYLAKQLSALEEERKKAKERELERERELEEQYREALREVRARGYGAGAESGSEFEEYSFI